MIITFTLNKIESLHLLMPLSISCSTAATIGAIIILISLVGSSSVILTNLAYAQTILFAPTKDNNNNLVLSWIREIDSSHSVFCYAISTDQGKSFSAPVEITGSTNVHPHGENLPKIIFKPSGTIIAAWGASNPNPKNSYAGLVYYSQSNDGGKTWNKSRTVSNEIESFDQILVLRRGRLVESGTHAQLLALRGDYSKMFQRRGAKEALSQ